MEIIFIMITSAVIFYFGVTIGYRLNNNQKTIELPKIEELKKVVPFTKEHKQSKEEEKEIEELNVLLANIDNYNGTEEGQVYFDEKR